MRCTAVCGLRIPRVFPIMRVVKDAAIGRVEVTLGEVRARFCVLGCN